MRKALVPHVVWQALALKDVAAGEAHALFDVRRPQYLTVNDCFRLAEEVPNLEQLRVRPK